MILVFLDLPGSAQNWQAMGPDDRDWPTLNIAKYYSMAVSRAGTPYVVYQDYAMDNRATARRYNGERWVDAGIPGFSGAEAAFTSIAVNANGVPYVAYQDFANGGRATVKKLVGGNWVNVGSPGFTESYALSTSIAISESGIPYIVYIDGYGPLAGAISVKKFVAGNWAYVGQRRFSEAPGVPSTAEKPSIAIAKDGTPYVVYHPANNNYKGTVKKFICGNWTDLGDIEGYPPYNGIGAALAIDNNNVPCVAYYNVTITDVSVKKFLAGSWVDIGSPGVQSSGVLPVYIAFDNSSSPYIAYGYFLKKFNGVNWLDVGHANGPIAFDNSDNLYTSGGVRKYTAGTWVDLGTPYGISEGSAYYISMTVDVNGIPYVVYQDDGNLGKATARKFQQGNWVYLGSDGGFSEDTAWYISSTMGHVGGNETPYVVYQDKSTGKKATVKKYHFGRWMNEGLPGFSAGIASYTSIDLDNQETPYVVYCDEANGLKATAKKYRNGSWKDVGSPGFSAGAVAYTSIVVGNKDIPYVAYSDGAKEGKVTVKKFKSGSWIDVGNPGFSSGAASGISMAINRWGTPYVAYREGSYVVVKYFFKGKWVDLGPPVEGGYTMCGSCAGVEIAIDGNDNPYIVFKVQLSVMNEEPPSSTMKYSVRKFNGADWVELWPQRLGDEMIPYPTIDIAITASGIPVVVYNHRFQAFAKSWGDINQNPEPLVTAQVYEKSSGVEKIKIENRFSLEVYPNPVGYLSHAHIELEKRSSLELRLFDIQGKMIWAKQFNLPEGTSVLELPTEKMTTGGIYILEAILAGGEKKTVKIAK